MDWLVFRALLLCAMFAVLAYHDLRTRTTNDRVLWIFGGAGALTYIADWQDFDMGYVGWCMVGAVVISFWFWRLSLFGSGDLLAFITATAIFPLYQNLPIQAVLILTAITIMGLFVMFLNMLYNITDLARGKLFAGTRDGKLRKAVAFFILHRQRSRPRHVFPAQQATDDGIHLVFRPPDTNADFAPKDGIGKTYVSFPVPAMPFMLAMAIMLLVHVL